MKNRVATTENKASKTMAPEENTKPIARERIVAAALLVFSEEGIKGATTREIAKRAQVNESTLFRIFETKEQVLGAVVEKRVEESLQFLQTHLQWTGNLHDDLLNYAQAYLLRLKEGEDFIRVFIGEAKRQPEAAKLVCGSAGKPIRDRLLAYFQSARENGQIRADIDLAQAMDCFSMLILGHVLNLNKGEITYTSEEFIKTAVAIFCRGVQADPVKGMSDGS